MRAMLATLCAMTLAVSATSAAADAGAERGAQAAFEKLQQLIGEWRAPLPRNEVMTDIFRPIAFGTAILHEEWKNGEQLTASVFYVVGSELRADHYCDMGNQLRYVARASDDPNVIDLQLRDATNLDTHPRHFHSTIWRFIDIDHHTQDWELMTPGKGSKIVRMEFTRTDPEAVVRADIRALNRGDAASLLALYSPDAKIFRVPEDADRLVGPLSDKMGTHEQRKSFFTEVLSKPPLSRVDLVSTAAAGDLVAAKVKFSAPPDFAKSSYSLAIYRVRDGLIQDLWHLALADEDPSPASQQAEEVIRKFVSANNSGDVETFLAQFSPKAKNFRNTGDPHALGDKPSIKVVDEKSRRESYRAMFAQGAPAQVQTLATIALGNLIVARDVATLPTGKVVDELSVYRIEDKLIQHDWFIFEAGRR